jgi:UPF0755 protein
MGQATRERVEDHVERPRRLRLVLLLLAIAGLAGAAWFGLDAFRDCREPPPAGGAVTFTVPRGATGDDVVRLLADRGLIRCGGVVGGILLRDTGLQDDVLAGEHTLRRGMTIGEIARVLTTPPEEVPTVTVLFPEGLRIRTTYPGERTISSIAADELGLSADRLADLAESGRFSLEPYLPRGSGTVEGFLFPQTYEFVREGLDERAVIRLMLRQFETEVRDLPWDAARELGLSPYEVVIVASMVEREARVPHERPLIAGVIYNRLARGWTLGIDATLLYADPSPDGRLSTADIETDTPYNTRIRAGLPPTPIASPGVASIRAALQPRETDFMFYVLCGPDGSHRFSTTLAEHEANVDACLG